MSLVSFGYPWRKRSSQSFSSDLSAGWRPIRRVWILMWSTPTNQRVTVQAESGSFEPFQIAYPSSSCVVACRAEPLGIGAIPILRLSFFKPGRTRVIPQEPSRPVPGAIRVGNTGLIENVRVVGQNHRAGVGRRDHQRSLEGHKLHGVRVPVGALLRRQVLLDVVVEREELIGRDELTGVL